MRGGAGSQAQGEKGGGILLAHGGGKDVGSADGGLLKTLS
jgi:hypothetical protein